MGSVALVNVAEDMSSRPDSIYSEEKLLTANILSFWVISIWRNVIKNAVRRTMSDENFSVRRNEIPLSLDGWTSVYVEGPIKK